MSISKIVEIKSFDDPNEFMDALSPRSDLWNKHPEHWIYRGQRDSKWGLQPTAYRYESWKPFNHICDGLSTLVYDYRVTLQLELNAVWWFANQSDSQGLLVPGFDHTWFGNEQLRKKFHEDIDNKIINGKEFFPLPDWRSIFAMAQHYGIPTRMLDWSESAYIAAYFATKKAAKEVKNNNKPIEEGGYISVWALNQNIINSISWPIDERMIIVRAPWASNDNLRAQRGLFTLHECKNEEIDRSRWQTQDEALEKIIERINYKKDKPIIKSLQLNFKEAPVLLKLLSQIGINKSSLFPGYNGVVKYAEELQYHSPIT